MSELNDTLRLVKFRSVDTDYTVTHKRGAQLLEWQIALDEVVYVQEGDFVELIPQTPVPRDVDVCALEYFSNGSWVFSQLLSIKAYLPMTVYQIFATTTVNQIESAGSGPLDQAIYSSGQDKIFGVRGQWIYKFNATTGAQEAEFRFIDGAIGQASIVEAAGFLYVGTWQGVIWDQTTPQTNPDTEVFKINYALDTSSPLGLNAFSNIGTGNDTFAQGYSNLLSDGTVLYGAERSGAAMFFSVTLADVSTYNAATRVGTNNNPLYDMVLDTANGVMWMADWNGAIIRCGDLDYKDTFDLSGTTPSNLAQVLGLCLYPATKKLYAVNGTRSVYKANGDEALPKNFLNNFTHSTLTNLLQASAQPVKIKYNPNDGLIYIPTWKGNAVEILNPANDTITAVKTGFNSPFDMVFTPTKQFAVQLSNEGLKEVT